MSSHRVPRGNKSLLFLVLKMYPSHLIFAFLFFGKHISHKACQFNHFSMWSSEAPVCLRRVATALAPSRHRARGGPCSAVQLRHSACVGPCASAESHAACPAVPGWSLGFAVPGFVRAAFLLRAGGGPPSPHVALCLPLPCDGQLVTAALWLPGTALL